MATVAIPPAPQTGVIVSEKKAKWLGIPLVSLFAAAMTGLAVYEMARILMRVLILGADVYVLMAVIYFWLSRSWKDGVTIKEFGYNLLWFLGLRKLIKSARADGIRRASGLHIHSNDDHSWRICPSQTAAIIIGIVVMLSALVILPILVVIHLFHLAVAMIWFVVALWGLCDAVYYLSGRVWQDGLTVKELFASVFGGPFAVAIQTYKAARQHYRHPQAMTIDGSTTPVTA